MYSLVCWNLLTLANQNIWKYSSSNSNYAYAHQKKWQFKVSLPCTFSVGDWVRGAEAAERQFGKWKAEILGQLSNVAMTLTTLPVSWKVPTFRAIDELRRRRSGTQDPRIRNSLEGWYSTASLPRLKRNATRCHSNICAELRWRPLRSVSIGENPGQGSSRACTVHDWLRKWFPVPPPVSAIPCLSVQVEWVRPSSLREWGFTYLPGAARRG
jgi:hypothetical protein